MTILKVPITLQVRTTSSGLLVDVCTRIRHLTALMGLATERTSHQHLVEFAPDEVQQALRNAVFLYATSVLETLAHLCSQTALAINAEQIKFGGVKAKLTEAEIQFLQSESVDGEYILQAVSILAHQLGEKSVLEDDQRFEDRLINLLHWKKELVRLQIAADNPVLAEHTVTQTDILWSGQTVVWYVAALLSLPIFHNDINHDALIQLTIPIILLAFEERELVEDVTNIPWPKSAREALQAMGKQIEVNLSVMQENM